MTEAIGVWVALLFEVQLVLPMFILGIDIGRRVLVVEGQHLLIDICPHDAATAASMVNAPLDAPCATVLEERVLLLATANQINHLVCWANCQDHANEDPATSGKAIKMAVKLWLCYNFDDDENNFRSMLGKTKA